MAVKWRYFGVIFKKNSLIMVLSNDYRNDFTFQITCPSKPLTTYIGTYTHRCVPQLGLLNDRVESGNQADTMVAGTIIHVETIINFKNKFTVTIKFGLCVLEDWKISFRSLNLHATLIVS